jgi:biopolymer transport protein ExbD
MRRSSHAFDRRSTLGVTMTPMIDVVFLLLVFFVWTASFQAIERSLPSRLLATPGSGSAAEIDPELADFERVVVRVQWRDNQPSWQVNDRPLAGLDQVRQTLAAIAAIGASVPVVIDSAPEVPLGYVIDVYDLARLEGFGEVQFAAPEEL